MTHDHRLLAGVGRLVQVTPSGDVITRLGDAPYCATATNSCAPGGPPQVTLFQLLDCTTEICVFHVTPSVRVPR